MREIIDVQPTAKKKSIKISFVRWSLVENLCETTYWQPVQLKIIEIGDLLAAAHCESLLIFYQGGPIFENLCCGGFPGGHRDPILIVYTVYCTEYSKNTEIKIYTEKISILRTSVYTVGYTPEYSEYSTFPIKSSIF